MGSRGRRRSDSEDDRTLFAKGLCYSTTEETLVETFGALSARIPLNNQGRSKGFAYIEFEDEDKAEDALAQNNGIEIDGWVPVLDYVGRKRKNYDDSGDGGGRRRGNDDYGGGRRDRGRRDGGRRDRDSDSRRYGGSYGFQAGGGRDYNSRPRGRGSGQDNSQNRTVYVKNIAPDSDENSLMDLLGCSSVRIPRYQDDEIKGFAYADFEDHASAQSAIDSLNGEDGLFLEFARERGAPGGGRDRQDNLSEKTLYIRGISLDTDEDSLADLLGCLEVRIPLDRDTNENKGFAYADFKDNASAQKAIDNLSGSDGLQLEFARERGSGGRGGRRGGYRGGRRGGYRGGDY